jgi:hypothetical protein
LSADKNASALRDVTTMFKLVKRRRVNGGLVRWEVAHRPTIDGIDSHRRTVGARVDFVTQTTSDDRSFSSFSPTGADSPQIRLIRLLANDLKIETPAANVRDLGRDR